MMTETTEAMLSAIGSMGGPASEITRAFQLMGIAEDEIASAKRKNPAKAKAIQAAFMVVQPQSSFWKATDDLYREHCKEILTRIVNGIDLAPATDAEILWALCLSSQKVPPSTDFSLLYEKLFIKVFPAKFKDFCKKNGSESGWRESYPKVTDEMYATYRRQLRVENRGAMSL